MNKKQILFFDTFREIIEIFGESEIGSAAMDNIIEMLFQLNEFMPGVANHDTILYGIEAKYYSCKPNFIDNKTFKIYDDVYAIGDGAGVTRSLSQAGVMGLYLADNI